MLAYCVAANCEGAGVRVYELNLSSRRGWYKVGRRGSHRQRRVFVFSILRSISALPMILLGE